MGTAERSANGHLVVLASVRKSFGDNVVLDGIDLRISHGEAIVVAGPSGSGKSTMLRCINGLEPVDSGEIGFDGQPVDGSGKEIYGIRAQIGMVFQQFNLFPHMTVLDNITLAPLHVKALSGDDAKGGRGSCWSGSGFPRRPTTTRPTSPAASSSGWRSPARSPSTRS